MAALRSPIIFVYNKQKDAFGLLYHKVKDIHKLDIEPKLKNCNNNTLYGAQWCKVDMWKLKCLGADSELLYIMNIVFQSFKV